MNDDKLDIINQCTEFLRKSSRRYSKTLQRAAKDMSRYSGNFWDDDFKKKYRSGKKRVCLALNNWNVLWNVRKKDDRICGQSIRPIRINKSLVL